jgi:signal transduction histidine kinase
VPADEAGTALARPPWVSVSRPETVAKEARPVSSRRIFAQVLAGAAVVVVFVSVVGAFASGRLAERQAVNDAARVTDLLADAVVQPALDDALVKGDAAAVARFDTVVRAHVLGRSVVRVKLWTPDGRIVYSDDAQAIGLTFPFDGEEQRLLTHPTILAQVSDLGRPENRFEQGLGKLLEVYRPVWTPTGQPLLFETYSQYSTVTDRSGQLWRGFAGVTLSSLLLLVVLLVPILWRLLDRLKQTQQQREGLLQHAVDASDQERRRIAGSLHDGVVQELAATSFVVAGAAEQADRDGAAELAGGLRSAAAAVRQSIGGLRSLLVDIYPPNLASAGLEPALQDLAESLRARGVDVRLAVEAGAAARLSADQERLVFRVAQECLRNAARHASAGVVHLELRVEEHDVVLVVRDDGVGFDPAQVLDAPESGHFGVRVLADVAARGGAELQVASAPGLGARWRLLVPVA